ncbi:hypothetical protein HYV86_04345 [Candidatus Woesearchaeota archaeon]|nr:hypothetical protein [Candidatus Woesearchaeota archaeon]
MIVTKKNPQTRTYATIIILSISLLIFITPLLNSWYNQQPLLRGLESAYFLQPKQIDLESSPIESSISLYLITSLTSKLPLNALAFIPPIIAMSCISLLFILIHKEFNSLEKEIICLGLIIITPAMLILFSTISVVSFYLLLILLSLILLQSKNWGIKSIGIVTLLLSTQMTIALAITTIIILGIYFFKQSEDRMFYGVIGGSLAAVTLLSSLISLVPLQNPALEQPSTFNIIFDLNGITGISLFLVLLCITGIVDLFREKKGMYYLIAIVGSIGIYFIDRTLLAPIAIVLTLFAAQGILYLYNKKWKVEPIRNLTLLLLALGFLFTFMSYQQTATNISPTTPELQALEWINKNTVPQNVIFSTPENQYVILAIAQRTPFTKMNSPEHQNVTDAILNAQYINELFPLLDNANIEYIYLPQRVITQLPSDEKLLFLLQNERFKIVFQANQTTVWHYKQT